MSKENEQPEAERVNLETHVIHPIQPLVDVNGVVRFKKNAIVEYLLDNGGIDLNEIARKEFTREDREQFAQLIGYSYGGACDLSYMSDTVLEVAENEYLSRKSGKDQKDIRIAYLEGKLRALRETLADALHDFFEIHVDDLKGV